MSVIQGTASSSSVPSESGTEMETGSGTGGKPQSGSRRRTTPRGRASGSRKRAVSLLSTPRRSRGGKVGLRLKMTTFEKPRAKSMSRARPGIRVSQGGKLGRKSAPRRVQPPRKAKTAAMEKMKAYYLKNERSGEPDWKFGTQVGTESESQPPISVQVSGARKSITSLKGSGQGRKGTKSAPLVRKVRFRSGTRLSSKSATKRGGRGASQHK